VNKKACVIIVNYDGKKFMKDCLDSINLKTKYPNYKVIVVDNNSTDGSAEFLKKKYPLVKLIKRDKNDCISKAFNLGAREAIDNENAEYIYFLNNDTKVEMFWLTEAVKLIEKDPRIGIVGSKQLSFDGRDAISAAWMNPFTTKYYFGREEKEVDWVSGAGFLVKKDVFDKIGFFDESYIPFYYEETDFEKRAQLAGFGIFFCPASIFFHRGGASSSKKGVKEKFLFSFYRNRIRYFLKFYSFIFFLPRLVKDFVWATKKGKFRFLFRAYLAGWRSLNG